MKRSKINQRREALQMETRDKVENIIRGLAAAMHAVDMYGSEHKMVDLSVDELYADVSDVLEEVPSVTIGVIGEEMAYEKHPFYDASKQVTGLVSRLKKLEIEKFTFARGIERGEIAAFGALIARRSTLEDVKKISESGVLRSISIGKIGMAETEDDDTRFEEKDLKAVIDQAYDGGSEFLKKAAEDLKNKQSIDAGSARQIVGGIMGSLLRNRDLLRVMASTKSHDEGTFVHEVNVAIFTMIQAESLGMEEDSINDIGVASLLHDAGKLAVEGDIIRKEEKLTEEDRASLDLHPASGAKILLETPGVGVPAAMAAFEHHMKYDMTGYPEKKYGKSTDLVTLMVTIADFYDALRSERSYHKGGTPEKVHEIMMELSGTLFHPGLLDNFFRVIGVYPPGSLVELDTGEIGIVVKESRSDKERPQVEVLYDSLGNRLNDPYLADLTEKGDKDKHLKSIIRSIAPSDKYSS